MTEPDEDTPRIEILVTHSPSLYSPKQMYRAMWLAATLGASEFHLFENPRP